MRALRLATVALTLSIAVLQASAVNAQIVTTGKGVCRLCGHAQLDTQRYVNSFLNQLFFPNSAVRRASIATSLYLFTATYTMYGRLSPDPLFNSVTVAITAEIKNAVPTGKYKITVTTPDGTTTTKTYAIGAERFSVRHDYAPGAIDAGGESQSGPGGKAGSGPGSGGRAGPGTNGRWAIPTSNHPRYGPGSGGRPAKCSRSRREDRGNETILWCSRN